MGIMFGYMDYLIFAKWNINYLTGDTIETVQYIPSIITTLIDMALKFGGISKTNGAIFK